MNTNQGRRRRRSDRVHTPELEPDSEFERRLGCVGWNLEGCARRYKSTIHQAAILLKTSPEVAARVLSPYLGETDEVHAKGLAAWVEARINDGTFELCCDKRKEG